jgi:hypothetical protein
MFYQGFIEGNLIQPRVVREEFTGKTTELRRKRHSTQREQPHRPILILRKRGGEGKGG